MTITIRIENRIEGQDHWETDPDSEGEVEANTDEWRIILESHLAMAREQEAIEEAEIDRGFATGKVKRVAAARIVDEEGNVLAVEIQPESAS